MNQIRRATAVVAVLATFGTLASALAEDWKPATFISADQRPWKKGANLTGAAITGDRKRRARSM